MRIEVAGENALIVYFSKTINDEARLNITHLVSGLSPYIGAQLVDLIPSYVSVLVVFAPLKTDHLYVRHLIRSVMLTYSPQAEPQQRNNTNPVRLPVYYGKHVSPDLQRIAHYANLSVEDVIRFHQDNTYQVHAIGFAPGFAYLGETHKSIATPRLATPRKKVPKGAVGIADRQTAVYPATSPGGWNILGCCPLPMFNPNGLPIMPLQVGDTVHFYAIDEAEFIALGGNLNEWQGLI